MKVRICTAIVGIIAVLVLVWLGIHSGLCCGGHYLIS